MRKTVICSAAALALIACGGPKSQDLVIGDVTWTGETTEVAMTPVTPNCPAYTKIVTRRNGNGNFLVLFM